MRAITGVSSICQNSDGRISDGSKLISIVHRSDHYPLDQIERDFVTGAVIEPRRLRAGVVGDLLGLLPRALVVEVVGDSGDPEGVAADGRFDPGPLCPAADHPPDVASSAGRAVPPCRP